MNIARYQCVKYCLTLNHHSFPQKYFSHLGICLDSIRVFIIYWSWSCLGYDFNDMLERLKVSCLYSMSNLELSQIRRLENMKKESERDNNCAYLII